MRDSKTRLILAKMSNERHNCSFCKKCFLVFSHKSHHEFVEHRNCDGYEKSYKACMEAGQGKLSRKNACKWRGDGPEPEPRELCRSVESVRLSTVARSFGDLGGGACVRHCPETYKKKNVLEVFLNSEKERTHHRTCEHCKTRANAKKHATLMDSKGDLEWLDELEWHTAANVLLVVRMTSSQCDVHIIA